MRICPLCNGLAVISERCPHCGERLQDGGLLTDYADPYSPYVNQDTDKAGQSGCVHLLYCPQCGFDCRQYSLLIEV